MCLSSKSYTECVSQREVGKFRKGREKRKGTSRTVSKRPVPLELQLMREMVTQEQRLRAVVLE